LGNKILHAHTPLDRQADTQGESFQEQSLMLPNEPKLLSFHIAAYLNMDWNLKQDLLELESTNARLLAEQSILEQVVSQLAVMTQIEEAFKN
jgi:hypothetical protein